MNSLRNSLVLAGMLLLSASMLSAQATRISCKDGTKPKVGHFACWGRGGLVREAVKSEVKADAKATGRVAKKKTTAVAGVKKPVGKKTRASAAMLKTKKPAVKKAPAKRAMKNSAK